jgi:hypothetical protein
MPWFGQPAKIDGNDIVDGVIKGATAVMSLSKMKREREMEEVRFAQEQHEFKQKDEVFDQNKRSAALQMQGQEYQNVVLRNKATQTALQTAWEAGNEEAMTKFQMLSYQMITGNKYDDPVLQDELSKLLSSSPRLLQNPESMTIFKMMDDGRQLFETNKARVAAAQARASVAKDAGLSFREKDTLEETRRELTKKKTALRAFENQIGLGELGRKPEDREKNRYVFQKVQDLKASIKKDEDALDALYDKTETNSGLPNWLTPVDGEEDVFDYNPQ